MPSISLPTAEKQDRIYDIVLHQTAGRKVIPSYAEYMSITKRTEIPYPSYNLKSNSILYTDVDRGVWIAYQYTVPYSINVISMEDYSLVLTIPFSRPLSLGSRATHAYDGTNLFALYDMDDANNVFVVINTVTGTVTNKSSFAKSVANVTTGSWTFDKTTGYLYITDYMNTSYILMKDPLTNMALSGYASIIKVTLPDCTALGGYIDGDYIYVSGIKPNTTQPSFCKLNKLTLSTISSTVTGGTAKGSPATLYMSKDKKTLYTIYDGSNRALKTDTTTLGAVDFNGKGLFSRYGYHWYNPDTDKFFTLNYTNVSGNPIQYTFWIVDGKSTFFEKSYDVMHNFDVTNIALQRYDFKTNTVTGVVYGPGDRYYEVLLSTCYVVDFYREPFEGEII